MFGHSFGFSIASLPLLFEQKAFFKRMDNISPGTYPTIKLEMMKRFHEIRLDMTNDNINWKNSNTMPTPILHSILVSMRS